MQMPPLFVLSKILYTVWCLEYGLNSQGILVRFLSGAREFALLQAWRPAMDPFRHPMACVLGTSPSRQNRPLCEADRWPLSVAEVENKWCYSSTPLLACMACTRTGLCLHIPKISFGHYTVFCSSPTFCVALWQVSYASSVCLYLLNRTSPLGSHGSKFETSRTSVMHMYGT